MGWQKTYFDGTNPALLNRLKAMPYKEEPWSSRYPQLPGFLDQQPGMPTGNVIHDNQCWCRIWVDFRDRLTEKNMDSAGNQVYSQKAVWKSEWVRSMGLDIDTPLISRRLNRVSPTRATLIIENQGRSAQTGAFDIWIAPGENGSLVTPSTIPFHLQPGEKTEQTITIVHSGLVHLGAYLRHESFVPAGIPME